MWSTGGLIRKDPERPPYSSSRFAQQVLQLVAHTMIAVVVTAAAVLQEDWSPPVNMRSSSSGLWRYKGFDTGTSSQETCENQ